MINIKYAAEGNLKSIGDNSKLSQLENYVIRVKEFFKYSLTFFIHLTAHIIL